MYHFRADVFPNVTVFPKSGNVHIFGWHGGGSIASSPPKNTGYSKMPLGVNVCVSV